MILKFFSFIALILSFSAFSQSEKTTHYLTQEENQIWLASLESLKNKTLKLDAIKEKIISDSAYVSPRPGICLTGLNDAQRNALREREQAKPQVSAACKIQFVIQAENTYTVDLAKSPKYLTLVKMLNAKNTTSIDVLKGVSASAIYGSRARCGVVILSTQDDKIKEVLKNLNNQKTTKS